MCGTTKRSRVGSRGPPPARPAAPGPVCTLASGPASLRQAPCRPAGPPLRMPPRGRPPGCPLQSRPGPAPPTVALGPLQALSGRAGHTEAREPGQEHAADRAEAQGRPRPPASPPECTPERTPEPSSTRTLQNQGSELSTGAPVNLPRPPGPRQSPAGPTSAGSRMSVRAPFSSSSLTPATSPAFTARNRTCMGTQHRLGSAPRRRRSSMVCHRLRRLQGSV